MSHIRRSVMILVALTSSYLLLAQQEPAVVLTQGWRFTPGDDLRYAEPRWDDSAWIPFSVQKIWEEQGFEKLDQFAWYRVKFTLPSGLKKSARIQDGVRIYLGKINNFDQSYLNGAIIGSNAQRTDAVSPTDTSFIHADMSMYSVERCYVLKPDDPRLRWDSVNVLAIRVYDQSGQGGLWWGVPVIRMMNIKDYLEMDLGASPFAFTGGNAVKSFRLKNTSSVRPMVGRLTVAAASVLGGAQVARADRTVDLPPGGVDQVEVSVPRSDASTTVTYRFVYRDFPDTVITREDLPYVVTPPAPREPRINGPVVTGARPGRPFLFTVPASGDRPMRFSATGLPPGLQIDPATGIIAGTPREKGSYQVSVSVKNRWGEAQRGLSVEIGGRIALTPPMGWNSWNCWGLAVDAGKVRSSARVFAAKGLIDHGWAYINVDDGWEIKGDSPLPPRNPDGTIITNEKFPDMRALGDSIHALGLKFGIYSSPGPLTCGGYAASHGHEVLDARSYAQWGVDYLKYDWCSYEKLAKDTSRAELMLPYAVMRKALDGVDRDIVYSLCQYGMGRVWEWGADVGGNLWRTTGDITDTWESMREIGFSQVANAPFAGPGHWNDPDMLVVGWVGWGPNLHPTHLSPDEQYTHISLWCLLSAPLLIGCDLERLDEFTLNLLTNDEVLAIDQDPLGRQARPVVIDSMVQVWSKPLADGRTAIGVFNLGKNARICTVPLKLLGLSEPVILRDLWRQKDLGSFTGEAEVAIPPHGVELLAARKR